MEKEQSQEGIEALVMAYQAVDKAASTNARGYFVNRQLVTPSERITSDRIALHMSPRQFSGSNPRMSSSHNYTGLGMILFDQAAIREQAGELDAVPELKNAAHTMMTYATALGKIRDLSEEHSSLTDFTRKSVVGAGYRVGASFTIDAIYLTAMGAAAYYAAKKAGLTESIAHSASEFVQNLDPWKLGRVAAAVVAINFADYKWAITENLDSGVKWLGNKAKSVFRKKKNS